MKSIDRVPLSCPKLSESEFNFVSDCLNSNWISSRGQYLQEFEMLHTSYYKTRHAVAVSSGTAALHLAMVSLGIGPGDEVIVPAFTFAATANAVVHCGATPVLADVGREDWCIDASKCEALITPRTRAVIAVHIYGQPCNLNDLTALVAANSIFLLEDCAQAHGAMYLDRKVGSFGKVACFSFYGNKIITTGEGGLCLTNDDEIANRLRVLRSHGMTGNNPYWATEVGYNYRMTNVQAAIGVGQMLRIDDILKNRRKVALSYRRQLGNSSCITLQPELAGRSAVPWLQNVMSHSTVPSKIIQALAEEGIEARHFFTPLHFLPPFRDCKRTANLEISELLFERGVSLPCYEGIAEQDISRVCHVLQDAVAN